MLRLDADRMRRAESIFHEIVALPPEARPSALDASCGGDRDLRRLVGRLLEHDRRGPGSSDHAVFLPDARAAEFADEPAPPERIGAYRVVRRIGVGGMGVVFEATQESPRRAVAIKLIRYGLSTADSLRRFRQEAEILGQLEHAGIARIYEAGTAELRAPGWPATPQPFLAMELVRGVPLGNYVRRANPTDRVRLALIAELCDIVQHAHQRGVIHRDLKPANILVDEAGSPRVLDFGVARAVDPDPHATRTLETRAGQIVGTLTYMSPEQLAGDPRRIDTRSDIYALGVIAFELLAGRLPLDVGGLPLGAAVRALSERDPPRLRSLRRELAGDVDAIIAKSLEKDPARRYASAGEMGADIRRHLNLEPILARPQSTWYQISRFARRKRGLVVGALLAITTLLAGAAATAVFAWRESRSAARAAAEAARAGAVLQFLQRMLSGADPRLGRGHDLTVRELLAEAAGWIERGEFTRDPQVETLLQRTIGETYLSLGLYAEARAHLEPALAGMRQREPSPSLEQIEVMQLLGTTLAELGSLDAAEALQREALAAAQARLGERHVRVARALNDLGACLSRRKQLDAAEQCHRRALELRRTLPDVAPNHVAASLSNLGVVLLERGQPQQAEPLLREALEIRRRVLPPVHLDLAAVLGNLGNALSVLGDQDGAESLLREALQIERQLLDPRHPELATVLNNLALTLTRRNRNADALPLLREALDIHLVSLGPRSADAGRARLNFAAVLLAAGDPGADAEADAALEILRAAFDRPHPYVAMALHNVAATRLNRDPAAAETMLREALSILERAGGEQRSAVAHFRDSLGVALVKLQRFAEAAGVLEAALAERRELLGEQHYNVGLTRGNLGQARLGCGDPRAARAEAQAAVDILGASEASPNLGTALLVLAEARVLTDLPVGGAARDVGAPESREVCTAEIAALIDEALALRVKMNSPSSWHVADALRVRAILELARDQKDAARATLQTALQTLETAAVRAALVQEEALRIELTQRLAALGAAAPAATDSAPAP